jgi:hypothetical protein
MKKYMNLLAFILIVFFMLRDANALSIASPTEGQIVTQGQRLTIIVKPDEGEKWEEVILNIYPMTYNILTKDYRQDIEIPEDEIGNIDFTVGAYDSTGKEIEVKRSLFVKMPPNVVLQSINVENLMILYKAPADLNPDDKKTFEERQITVAGIYSDGFNRQITSSSMGTTYTSSDEKIVKVDSEGKVTPQALGTANITIRNGKYSATVKVIVKPYKK